MPGCAALSLAMLGALLRLDLVCGVRVRPEVRARPEDVNISKAAAASANAKEKAAAIAKVKSGGSKGQLDVLKQPLDPQAGSIKDQCRARLLRFDQLGEQNLATAGNDPLFPPIASTIAAPGTSCGDSAAGISESCAKFNHWKTFQQVADKTHNPFKVFGPSGLQFGDIGQGQLGNCYFLSALAAAANEHPQIIEDMFVERASWANNIFKTRWLVNGKETVVSVDNMIPANGAGTFFAQQSATGEFWPVILAKAWAKIYGSFKAIEGGFAGDVIEAMTQAPSIRHHHNTMSREELFKLLLDATQAKFPMCAGTSANAEKYGLAVGHAYTILSAFVHPTYGNVVKMFNPWRRDFYNGAVPNTVKVNGPQKGVFTLKLAEFHDAFKRSEIAEVRSGYVATSQTIATGQANQMLVSVSSPGQFFVSLTWPGKRMMQPCHLSRPDGMVVAAKKLSVKQKSRMLMQIPNYNRLTTQVENVQGGKYEAFANVKFPATVTVNNNQVPAVAVDQVQFTVYAPGVAVIVSEAAAAAKAACQDSTTYKDPQYGELCSAWVDYKCTGYSFTEALETNCPKACNKCTAVCQDSTTYKDPQYGDLCSAWVDYKCTGHSFTEALETNCPKACEKCTAACQDSTTYQTPPPSIGGFCGTWASYKCTGYSFTAELETNCPKSCKKCTAACQDSTTYEDPHYGFLCSAWAGYKCTGFPFTEALETNCPKACKKCTA